MRIRLVYQNDEKLIYIYYEGREHKMTQKQFRLRMGIRSQEEINLDKQEKLGKFGKY